MFELNKLEEVKTIALKSRNKVTIINYLMAAKKHYCNLYYNKGISTLSDRDYDFFIIDTLRKLDPKNSALTEVGSKPLGELLKCSLPYTCGSLLNIKEQDVVKWLDKLKVEKVKKLIGTQKLDGIALLALYIKGDLYKVYKRGNGKIGFDVTRHAQLMNSIPKKIAVSERIFAVRGEAVMKENLFIEKYKKGEKILKGYKTSRNMVAGQFTTLNPDSTIMKDIDFVCYEIKNKKLNKVEQLRRLEDLSFKVVSFCEVSIENACFEIFTEYLKNLRSISPYLMDGLVLDVNSKIIREKMGFEASTINPKYARAYKVRTKEDEYITTVKDIIWSVLKNGLVKPRVQFQKIDIKGVEVSFATGKNAKTIKKLGIDKGAIIKVTRSGDTIPDILSVVKPASNLNLINYCPSCNEALKWTTNTEGECVDLYCINNNCVGRKEKRILAFFRILGVKGINNGIVRKCIKADYNSIEKILAMAVLDFEELEGIKNKSATKLYQAIHKTCKEISLSKLMYATGFFGRSLGSSKLEGVIEIFGNSEIFKLSTMKDHDIKDIISSKVPGIKETAVAFAEGIKKFVVWYNKNSKYFKFREKEELIKTSTITSNKLSGYIIVFTKFRDSNLENIIRSNGGQIGNGVTKKTSIVVTPDPSESSSKLKKARTYNIEIQSKENFMKWLERVID